MATVSSRFRIKKYWSEQSDSNRCLTVLQTVAFIRLAMLAEMRRFKIQDLRVGIEILNLES